MSAICLIDTCVFVKILKLPNMGYDDMLVDELFKEKIIAGEIFFIPMAVLFETGNHIGQNGTGNDRRTWATRFVEQIKKAMNNESPFTVMNFLENKSLEKWIGDFPAHASKSSGPQGKDKGSGISDLAIMKDLDKLRELHRGKNVYIWSFDEHLVNYDLATRP